jgi:hypothetical protein
MMLQQPVTERPERPEMFRGTAGKTRPTTARYTLVIEALLAATLAAIRLRQALKLLLRAFSFRCLEEESNR